MNVKSKSNKHVCGYTWSFEILKSDLYVGDVIYDVDQRAVIELDMF